MLLASNIIHQRRARDYPRKVLSAVTMIALARLAELENRKAEPWFDEARAISRALNVRIYDLFAPVDLHHFDYDPRFFDVDLKFWGDGVRLPVSVALRLAHRFGVAPDDLDPSPLMQQIWAVVAASERNTAAEGKCPWCLADALSGASHSPHCLPHLLLGTYNARHGVPVPGTADAPRPGRKGHRSGSVRVSGLKTLRESLDKTQAQMARIIDCNVNHYARIERGELPLTLARAEALCQQLNISRDTLFEPDVADPVTSRDETLDPGWEELD